jgi:hypothetical protein
VLLLLLSNGLFRITENAIKLVWNIAGCSAGILSQNGIDICGSRWSQGNAHCIDPDNYNAKLYQNRYYFAAIEKAGGI